MASITIVGSGFTGATQCFFGSTAVPITTMNSAGTSFICTPPAGSGTVSIGITSEYFANIIGTGVFGYTYMAPPTTSSLGTTMGPVAGGTSVVITGTNFYDRSSPTFPGSTLPVAFGLTASTGGVINSTLQVTVSTPAFLTAAGGAVLVNLNTPTGTASNLTYTYIALPTLTSTSFGPAGASGPMDGGTQLRIIGTNLSTTSGVTMGGLQGATLQVIEATGVTLLSPPSSTEGAKSIVVTTAGGITSGITFTYVAVPNINTVSPVAGLTGGGTTVTVFGTKLSNPWFVFFGITAGTGVLGNAGGTYLTVSSPESKTTGLVNISVRTAGGTGTKSDAYTYVPPMTISSVTPNRGPTGGG
jgi:hypothetical protein